MKTYMYSYKMSQTFIPFADSGRYVSYPPVITNVQPTNQSIHEYLSTAILGKKDQSMAVFLVEVAALEYPAMRIRIDNQITNTLNSLDQTQKPNVFFWTWDKTTGDRFVPVEKNFWVKVLNNEVRLEVNEDGDNLILNILPLH